MHSIVNRAFHFCTIKLLHVFVIVHPWIIAEKSGVGNLTDRLAEAIHVYPFLGYFSQDNTSTSPHLNSIHKPSSKKKWEYTMAEPAYITISGRKWEQVTTLIPAEWRLDNKYIPRAMRLSPLESVHQLHEFEEEYPTNILDVPRECGILSAKEVRITEGHDVRGLLSEMVEKRLSAEEVALAFCKVCRPFTLHPYARSDVSG